MYFVKLTRLGSVPIQKCNVVKKDTHNDVALVQSWTKLVYDQYMKSKTLNSQSCSLFNSFKVILSTTFYLLSYIIIVNFSGAFSAALY